MVEEVWSQTSPGIGVLEGLWGDVLRVEEGFWPGAE
jgi:hypothetical protein